MIKHKIFHELPTESIHLSSIVLEGKKHSTGTKAMSFCGTLHWKTSRPRRINIVLPLRIDSHNERQPLQIEQFKFSQLVLLSAQPVAVAWGDWKTNLSITARLQYTCSTTTECKAGARKKRSLCIVLISPHAFAMYLWDPRSSYLSHNTLSCIRRKKKHV